MIYKLFFKTVGNSNFWLEFRDLLSAQFCAHNMKQDDNIADIYGIEIDILKEEPLLGWQFYE